MGMRIQDIVNAHPTADFILSRDPLPDEIYSIANTGFIIMKNTPWYTNNYYHLNIIIVIIVIGLKHFFRSGGVSRIEVRHGSSMC